MKLSLAFIFIGMLLLVFGTLCLIYVFTAESNAKHLGGAFSGGITSVLLALMFLILGADNALKLEEELKKEATKTFYYEGFKVDIEDVNLKDFTITYDAENNIYTLTKKVEE